MILIGILVLYMVDRALISNFDFLSPKEATFLLSAMGLSSVPTWLRAYGCLSNGEQYRANLAYLVGTAKENEIILIDEFTSVVNREVAKSMSYSLQKYVRKFNKRLIIASCHFDIFDWLMPDWICSPEKDGKLERRSLRQEKPKIELQVSRCDSKVWEIFKDHHYLTADVNKACKFYLFEWYNYPVAIVAIINRPHAVNPYAQAISRVVVLPDYQGLGIGSKIIEFISGIYKNNNQKMYIKTINPALGKYFEKSDNWRPSSSNGKVARTGGALNKKVISRPSYCYEYIGKKVSNLGYLIQDINSTKHQDAIEKNLFNF